MKKSFLETIITILGMATGFILAQMLVDWFLGK
jgi:hypothetical protein